MLATRRAIWLTLILVVIAVAVMGIKYYAETVTDTPRAAGCSVKMARSLCVVVPFYHAFENAAIDNNIEIKSSEAFVVIEASQAFKFTEPVTIETQEQDRYYVHVPMNALEKLAGDPSVFSIRPGGPPAGRSLPAK